MQIIFNSKKQIISVLVLLFMLLSCSKDEEVRYNGDTASLSLHIPMLECETRTPIDGSQQEDAIYELRVVILSQGAESINKVFTKEELESAQGVITIERVPVGTVQMYVIANEKSIGKDYTDLKTLQDDLKLVPGYGRNVLVLDEGRVYFPKRRSEQIPLGLPMSWKSQFKVFSNVETPQSVDVELQRCVAKLNIIMSSTLSEDLLIKEMNFGEFFGDRLYLFQERSLDVPDDCNYVSKDYIGLDITIPTQGEKTLVCYIYPSFAWQDPQKSSPYTIGFKTDKDEYPIQQFIKEGVPFNSIPRNTQVNILAKLSKPANIELSFEVLPWDKEIVDVPSFN